MQLRIIHENVQRCKHGEPLRTECKMYALYPPPSDLSTGCLPPLHGALLCCLQTDPAGRMSLNSLLPTVLLFSI